LCHEMLTGHLPFVGDTTVAVLMAHIIQTAPRASEVCPELSPLFDAPLLRMLDKKPDERPSSAGEAVAALRLAAQEAGIALGSGPLRLPRPDPLISGEQLRFGGTPDTLLDEGNTTEPDAVAAATASASARPLWPFALGLLVLGALLGFAVLRTPATEPKAEPSATPPKPSVEVAALPAAAPSAVAPAPSDSAVAAPSSVPSAAASPASTPDKKPKPRVGTGTGAPARIPTDLENPF
jgi:serine/threonine protein kinase